MCSRESRIHNPLLILQQWHGLIYYELEIQAIDRSSFQNFLCYPESIPDRSTIWRFRERLIKCSKEEVIWNKLQNKIAMRGLIIKRDVCKECYIYPTRSWSSKAG
ncbi:transposase [uncultured Methanospirillum sp.]|uniref:transposase n=1 Tax=uncultured Methanospirillum sp. TaxID=262503 RepID=UPI0037499684